MVALHRIVCAFCVFTTVASSGPGWAQSFGQQPPAPSGLGFGQGQGATPSPGYGQSLPAPSPAFLAGTWSGQFQDQSGTIHGTTGFGSDGSFVMVVQLPNQVLERVWGRYQVAAAGPSQSKVDYQVEGWLPRTFCTQVQAPGAPLNCQPVRVPSTITAEFRITSQSTMIDDKNVTLIRDPSPYLLQQQSPNRWSLPSRLPCSLLSRPCCRCRRRRMAAGVPGRPLTSQGWAAIVTTSSNSVSAQSGTEGGW